MGATVDTDERIRTCALCQRHIADGCPNTLEHVRAQRDHYWSCLKRMERVLDRLLRERGR